MMGYCYYGNGYGGGAWGGIGFLFTVIFWILIIWGVVVLIRMYGSGGRHHHRRDDALSILRERYVRGEINKEEYEEKKRMLDSEDLSDRSRR